MKGSLKKLLHLGFIMCIVLSIVLSGCNYQVGTTHSEEPTGTQQPADTTQQPADTTKSQEPEKPYEFSIFRTYWTHLNDETDPVIQELNKKFNIKIKIETCPYETWIEKYNIFVTSGDIPDLSITTGPGTANFDAWAKQEIYLDLLDLYYQHCPNIQKYLNSSIVEAHKMLGGKLYGIPKPSLSDAAYTIRQDWLDNLGLSMPSTLDELYGVLKAFKEQDPDQNQKDDTYGLCTEDTLTTIDFVFRAHGCNSSPNTENWIPDGNGKLTATILAPGMKDSIVFVHKLYHDGILDPEWMLIKSQAFLDKVLSGKVGYFPTGFQQMITYHEERIKANDPSVKLAILDGVKGPEGENVRPMQKGFYMVSSISKEAKNPVKILEFIDYLMTDEGDTLIRYGIEGLTYEKKPDGTLVRDEEAVKKYGMEAGHSFRQIMQPTTINVMPADDPRTPELKQLAQILYEGPFYPAPTLQPGSLKEVSTRQGADYVKDSVAAIVVGDADPAAEWDKFIQNWRATGGDLLIKEINELYEANQK